MFPASFKYCRTHSLEECVSVINQGATSILILLVGILLIVGISCLFRVKDRSKFHRNFARFTDNILDNKKTFIFLIMSIIWVLFHYYSIPSFFIGFIYFLEIFLFLIIADIILWRFTNYEK
ncbi:MAG: hypothetical protein AABY22_23525 [Nanoarchaeota archaeon]